MVASFITYYMSILADTTTFFFFLAKKIQPHSFPFVRKKSLTTAGPLDVWKRALMETEQSIYKELQCTI